MQHFIMLRQLLTMASIGLTFSAFGGQVDDDFDLTLRRYSEGVGPYRECSVRVRGGVDFGHIEVGCLSNAQQPVDSGGAWLLTRQEIAALRRLVTKSALYEGSHAGADPRHQELPFETLQIMCCSRTEVVVLVVSGNQTFVDDAFRHQLVQLMRKLEASTTTPDAIRTKD